MSISMNIIIWTSLWWRRWNWKWQTFRSMRLYIVNVYYLQSLYYETGQTVLFWDILWHKKFFCMNCETYLALEYAHKSTWPAEYQPILFWVIAIFQCNNRKVLQYCTSFLCNNQKVLQYCTILRTIFAIFF